VRLATWIRGRGAFCWLNCAVVGVLLLIVEALLAHRSPGGTVFGRYSVGFAVYVSVVLVAALLYGGLALAGGPTLNRRLFLSVAAVFVIVEIVTGIWQRERPFQQDVYHYPQPYVVFTGQPNTQGVAAGVWRAMGGTEAEATISLNALGLRGPLPGPKGDEYRVLVLGGSAAFNGVPLSRSIPGELERRYLESGRARARVYNWGVVSAVSGQELALLVHHGVDYAPDLVIAYDGANDVIGPYWYDPRPGYPFDFLVVEAGRAYLTGRGTPTRRRLLTLLMAESHALRALFGPVAYQILDFDGKRAETGYRSEAWQAQIVDAYVRNVEKMCMVGNAYRFRVAVVLQPLWLFKKTTVGRERQVDAPGEFRRFIDISYRRIRERLATLQRAHGPSCTFVDLSEMFDDAKQEVFWDFIHVSNEGNRLVAEEIYRRLGEGRRSAR
jgi:hypothetical protein